MEEASLWMQCNNCGEKHRRYPTEKPVYSARKCNRCQCHHAAKEVRNCILSTHEACGKYDLMTNHAMHDAPKNYCWSIHSNSHFRRSSCIVWLALYNLFVLDISFDPLYQIKVLVMVSLRALWILGWRLSEFNLPIKFSLFTTVYMTVLKPLMYIYVHQTI